MPYKRKGKCVYKQSGGKVGCSASAEKAKKYIQALYANEPSEALTEVDTQEFLDYVSDEFDIETLELLKGILDKRVNQLNQYMSAANPRKVVKGYRKDEGLKYNAEKQRYEKTDDPEPRNKKKKRFSFSNKEKDMNEIDNSDFAARIRAMQAKAKKDEPKPYTKKRSSRDLDSTEKAASAKIGAGGEFTDDDAAAVADKHPKIKDDAVFTLMREKVKEIIKTKLKESKSLNENVHIEAFKLQKALKGMGYDVKVKAVDDFGTNVFEIYFNNPADADDDSIFYDVEKLGYDNVRVFANPQESLDEYNSGMYYDDDKAKPRPRPNIKKEGMGGQLDEPYFIEVSVRDARKALDIFKDQYRDADDIEVYGTNVYASHNPDNIYDLFMDLEGQDIELHDYEVGDNMNEFFSKPKKGHGEKISKDVFAKLKGKTVNYQGTDYNVIDSDEAVLKLKDDEGNTKTINLRQFNIGGLIDEIMSEAKNKAGKGKRRDTSSEREGARQVGMQMTQQTHKDKSKYTRKAKHKKRDAMYELVKNKINESLKK